MTESKEVVTISANQVEKLLEFGLKATKATLKFISEEQDYFQVFITLNTGTTALFLGERGKPRQYKNPVFFIQWAKKHAIETIEFESITMANVALRASRDEEE